MCYKMLQVITYSLTLITHPPLRDQLKDRRGFTFKMYTFRRPLFNSKIKVRPSVTSYGCSPPSAPQAPKYIILETRILLFGDTFIDHQSITLCETHPLLTGDDPVASVSF